MMTDHATYTQHLNGKAVELDDLQKLASANNGHFTSMQIRNKKVKGIELHLNRLKVSSELLFGCNIDLDIIRNHISYILNDTLDCSLRISIFSTSLNAKTISKKDLQILITKSDPIEMGTLPISVMSTVYERFLPQVKHIGISIGLLYHKGLAQLKGYYDVLYTDIFENISEGSIWNIGFYDGTKIILPNTSALSGITMELLVSGLKRNNIQIEKRKINIKDLNKFSSAFITNSISIAQPISTIDHYNFKMDLSLSALMTTAYDDNPWESL